MSPFDKIEMRMQNDAQFHALVMMLENRIVALELSPWEVREAAMYAAYRVEMNRAPSRIVLERAQAEAHLVKHLFGGGRY